MVAALKRVGGRVKYTELPDEGHEIWDSVYADPELVKWLFAQRTGR
jgi:predicted peptidase